MRILGLDVVKHTSLFEAHQLQRFIVILFIMYKRLEYTCRPEEASREKKQ